MPSYHTPSFGRIHMSYAIAPRITTLLQRSQGVPLTVNIQHYSSHTGCGCSHQPTWKAGDYCPHKTKRIPSLDLSEPFRAKIHTLNIRYLRKNFDAATMEDILKTPSSSSRFRTWSHSVGAVAIPTERFLYSNSLGNCSGHPCRVSRNCSWLAVGGCS